MRGRRKTLELQHKEIPSLEYLANGGNLRGLKQISRGTEFIVYLSKNEEYVIKIPRIYTRLLGIAVATNIEQNITRCNDYFTQHKLPIIIPKTFLVKYGSIFAIIQEYVNGKCDKELNKKLTKNLQLLPSERNYIDLTPDNILFHDGKPYLIDVSEGIFYRVARKYGNRVSRVFWHATQMVKICFKPSSNVLFQENKTYYEPGLADFLKGLERGNVCFKRIRIICWHLNNVWKLLSGRGQII